MQVFFISRLLVLATGLHFIRRFFFYTRIVLMLPVRFRGNRITTFIASDSPVFENHTIVKTVTRAVIYVIICEFLKSPFVLFRFFKNFLRHTFGKKPNTVCCISLIIHGIFETLIVFRGNYTLSGGVLTLRMHATTFITKFQKLDDHSARVRFEFFLI